MSRFLIMRLIVPPVQLGMAPLRLGSVCLEQWTPYLSQNMAPPLVHLGSLLACRAASAASV
eukprot:1626847-Prymnesium_polylepis.1